MAVGEWDQRQLCPDGGCVGVIGPDGTCKVCGRAAPNWGDERNRGLIDPPDEEPRPDASLQPDEDGEDDEDGDDDDGGDDGGDIAAADDEEADGAAEPVEDASRPPASSGTPASWNGRELCPEGSCIGVIGPDGRCKVCGRAAASPGQPAETAPAGERGAAGTDPDPER